MFEVVVSLLHKCILWMDIVSEWRAGPLKQKACESAAQEILIGHVTWEPIKLSEPMQCGTEAGVVAQTDRFFVWSVDWGLRHKLLSFSQR